MSGQIPFYLIYNLRMENLSMLAQKVLSMLEKDQTKWAEWTQLKDLYPVSESDAVKGFVDIIKQAKKKIRIRSSLPETMIVMGSWQQRSWLEV